jgi:hypothetical protein
MNKGAPTAQFDFDECTGTALHDVASKASRSSTKYDGTITPNAGRSAGNCNSGTSTEMWNGGTTGKFNSSLAFDGAGDFVTAGTSTGLNLPQTFTLSAWIKLNGTCSTYCTIISKWGTNGDRQYQLYWVGNNITFRGTTNGFWSGSPVFSTTSNSFTSGSWHHIVIVADGANIHLYVNGIEKRDGTFPSAFSSTLFASTSTALQIAGNQDTTDYFGGQIDEVKVYNYPLTTVQIRNLYNQSSAVKF